MGRCQEFAEWGKIKGRLFSLRSEGMNAERGRIDDVANIGGVLTGLEVSRILASAPRRNGSGRGEGGGEKDCGTRVISRD